MTSASILDISEIEDDEVPLAVAASGHAHLRHNQTNQNSNINSNSNSNSNNNHNNYDADISNQQEEAQFYLFNEDLNPQRRIPNVLSTLINSQPAQANLSATSLDYKNEHLQLRSHTPNYNNNSINIGLDSAGKQQLELTNMGHEHALGRSGRPTPSPNPANGEDLFEPRPFTPATNQQEKSEQRRNDLGQKSKQTNDNSDKAASLGTLSGVYFPCVQNIFGVILFIRMVWIVGTAGVPAAFMLVFICCCVTLTTSISLSAIATNGIVPAGGSYFMISRSLGPECGGAVGTMFFLGTTAAGAMYITGAVEIMLNYLAPSWGLFGDFQRDVNIMYHNIRVYGTLLLMLVGILVWIGVKFVSKLAPIALFCVLFSIFSIYAGIFINYNGRPDLMICVVGDRLVTLKNIPYEDPQRASIEFAAKSNQTNRMSQSELATVFQLRRTRALCTYDKLSHIFCPDESVRNEQQRQQQQTSDDQSGEQNDPSLMSIEGQQQQIQLQLQQQQQRAKSLDDAEAMAELFKRAPNMSNCDSYFRANKHNIHLERAVPGIASGVLFENLKPRFRNKRTIVSYDDGINTNEHSDFNQVFVDITTSFTILISIYFPSCTGILAGSNRSGDLRDAQKSIPRGTITAQLTTSFVYLSCIILFGATFNNLFIRDKFGESMGGQLAVTQIAWPHPYVILIGGLLSTLGAALQSLVGAPRVLQGIAKDEVIPCFNRFAKLSPRGEPETAIIFTLFLSWLGVLIGNLDFIAPILTISLVMCYFFINLACTLHSLLGSPNWRPRFKHYHWSISSLGCLLCLFVMIVSSLVYFLVAIFIAGCIYKYIEFSGAEKEWGDGKQGLALSAARYNLLRLKTSEPHTKNWRPQLLLFCKLKPAAELEPPSAKASRRSISSSPFGSNLVAIEANNSENNDNNNNKQLALSTFSPGIGRNLNESCSVQGGQGQFDNFSQLKVAQPKLLTFASQLKAGKGLTLVSTIIEGDFKQLAPLAARARLSLQESMNEEKVKGFADVVVAPSIMDGLSHQVQTAGLGGLKQNTVIVGWPEHWRRYAHSSNPFPSKQPETSSQVRGSFKQHQHQQQSTSASGSSSSKQLKGSNEKRKGIGSTRAHLFIELMRNVQVSQNAFLVVKGVESWPESCDKLGGFIDIWWIVNDGGLLMLLPHLLKQHRTWKSCQLRIFTVAQASDNVSQMRDDLTKFLYHLRIEAQVDIVQMNNVQVSAYAYERTLMMEQRSEIMKRFNVNRKQSILLEQEIDGRVMRFRIRKPSTCDFEDSQQELEYQQYQCQHSPSITDRPLPIVSEPIGTQAEESSVNQMKESEMRESSSSDSKTTGKQQQQQQQQESSNNNKSNDINANTSQSMRPDETNVRRMHTALTLNEAILKRSKSSKLVIINLPGAPKASTCEAENNYMEFIEIITDKLERVLLVQNGGREVITIHS